MILKEMLVETIVYWKIFALRSFNISQDGRDVDKWILHINTSISSLLSFSIVMRSFVIIKVVV